MAASAVASALAAAFGVVVAGRWWRTRRPAFAAWAAGLFIFAAAALTQAIGEHSGFSPALFRAFYLLGGDLGVIYLALGTVFLLAPARVARASAVVLVVLTVLLAVDAAVVPVDLAKLGTGNPPKLSDPLGSWPLIAAAIVFNIVGTLVLCGGSAWSAWSFARKRSGFDRVVCNVLLTTGGLVIAIGFSALKVGATLRFSTLGLYEAVGIAVMFAGFLSLGRVGTRLPLRSTLAG